jgi:integrase/recombinase XerD
MSVTTPLGPIVQSCFADHLITIKGLRPASVRSYRDTLRLFLLFLAADKHCKITRLRLADLTSARILPLEWSIHSSTLGRNSSINIGRATG